jgi:hypothetical protein
MRGPAAMNFSAENFAALISRRSGRTACSSWPNVEVRKTDNEIKVTAELPICLFAINCDAEFHSCELFLARHRPSEAARV